MTANSKPVVSFAKLDRPVTMPHFLDVQRAAFDWLLQPGVDADDRKNIGLQRVFRETFPIEDPNGTFTLDFVSYSCGEPKHEVDECIDRDMTYQAPLAAKLRLVVKEGDDIVDMREKEVYLGDLPLLTRQGTFIVNGAERVVVSQLHRSPGVVFEETRHPNGTRLFSSRVIPFRGSWVEFRLDIHDVIHVHIDKKKKFPATALLRAFGYGRDLDILEAFYERRVVQTDASSRDAAAHREIMGTFVARSVRNGMFGEGAATLVLDDYAPVAKNPHWLADDLPDPRSEGRLAAAGELIDDEVARRAGEAGIASVEAFDDSDAFVIRCGEILDEAAMKRLERAEVAEVEVYSSATFVSLRGSYADLEGRRDWSASPQLAADVVDPNTGEVLAGKGDSFDRQLFANLRDQDIEKALVFTGGSRGESPLLRNTLSKDPTGSEERALQSIYSLVRAGDAPNVETARLVLERLFFDPKRYDLGRVGRHKINQRLRDMYLLLGLSVPDEDVSVLTRRDFLAIIRHLIELHEGRSHTDDIDHLGNRRVRSIGELIANQFSLGLSRMARLVRERMSMNSDPGKISFEDLVNARTVSAVIQAFFGSSQLSQFMDQANPLSELTHKRRLSALGPGGLTRERAGFEVRDVHYSHYGRMCPIETPEGQNIGLITSVTTYSRINELGFLETPYLKVVDGRVKTDDVVWLTASEEEVYAVAQASAKINPDGTFAQDLVLCRRRADYPLLPPEEIDFMDVAPDQLVAVSPALIPFLEHNDANRALMGSNMQRQAVPLLFPERPLVGTGLESKVAQDSGSVVLAKRAGVVTQVTADSIQIDTGRHRRAAGAAPLARLTQYDWYRLRKFWRTNQDTAINQRPIVSVGQKVKPGEVIADGAATDGGSLALGVNVLAAFMPWFGHNFEDAIIISEKLVQRDIYTSVHIEELELHVRDTKRGKEEITREIPNVSDEALVDLDERGIVRIGAAVRPGDILAGKITPKGETELSPEEKLLTAIFGEKAKDVMDSSLRVPPGIEGTVIDVKIFSRKKDDLLLERMRGEMIAERRRQEREEITRVSEARDEELLELLKGEKAKMVLRRGGEPYFREGKKLTKTALASVDFGELDLSALRVESDEKNAIIRNVVGESKNRVDQIREQAEKAIDRIFEPDELSPGVIQLVKVYIAEKRKIAVGDKMAGRHGNKGIIARVVPEEDMPILPDGSSVEIVLNPLGVPSRMNVGQILETTLGWSARTLGFEAHTPVFQGAKEHEIGALLKIGGAYWAARTLGSNVTPLELPQQAVQRMIREIQAHEDDYAVPGDSEGLGRPLDAYLGGKGELAAYLQELAGFIVAVVEDLAGEERSSKRWREEWPEAAAIAGKRKLATGLDAAAVELMERAGLRPNGKMRLRDGRTGEEFVADVAVGVSYMMKLSHLVDDKIHARSIGPYSLVTQQPLAGKAQFGGQRFGEMEVWALEAYGAAHTLQEMLTLKSDDVVGRSRVYEAIVKGDNLPEPGVPESFHVLVKELEALGLSITLGSDSSGGIFEPGQARRG